MQIVLNGIPQFLSHIYVSLNFSEACLMSSVSVSVICDAFFSMILYEICLVINEGTQKEIWDSKAECMLRNYQTTN